jgi:hypothetical protein
MIAGLTGTIEEQTVEIEIAETQKREGMIETGGNIETNIEAIGLKTVTIVTETFLEVDKDKETALAKLKNNKFLPLIPL